MHIVIHIEFLFLALTLVVIQIFNCYTISQKLTYNLNPIQTLKNCIVF